MRLDARWRLGPGAVAAAVIVAACAAPHAATSQDLADARASATLMDAAGNEIGQVLLRETAGHGVLLDIRIAGMQPGPYAIHIHETGACVAPSFESAGGHYDPHDRAHGVLHPEGMHGGDLLNIHVPAGGELRIERLAADVTLERGAAHTLFDDDGSAIVVHSRADDYRSQPSGDAGPRALCGVVRS
jgi:Cu-Zn family superoxide dismutase